MSTSIRVRRRTRFRLVFGCAASLSVVGLGGCLYSFKGGGLPAGVKTVAVLPFENQTPEPTLTQDVLTSVRQAMEGRLGLSEAGENQADAVVRGYINRYEPDLPVAYTGTNQQVEVTKRLVQITVSVEIVDQKQGKTLWQRSGLTEVGDYAPPNERDGRQKALDKIVNDIVEGAQSQW